MLYTRIVKIHVHIIEGNKPNKKRKRTENDRKHYSLQDFNTSLTLQFHVRNREGEKRIEVRIKEE